MTLRTHRSAPYLTVLVLGFLVASCKGDSITDRDPESVFGNALVSVRSFGVDIDPDGYLLNVRGIEEHDLPTFGDLDLRVLIGPARLTMRGIADNCHLSGDSVRTVTVAPDADVQETFVVTCGTGKQHLAFASFRSGQADLYLRREGDVTEQQLTSSDWRDSDPVWSPNGNRLAYATLSPDSATALIRIISVNGDSLGTIGSVDNHADYPAWAPSEDKIVFAWDKDGNYELYLANPDGSGLVRLTNTPQNELRPAWSPDGSQIVFDRDVDDTTIVRDLFVMNADGSGVRQLSTGGRYNFHASWSPDGKWIAFVSQRDGNEEVYVTSVDGSQLIRLTSAGGGDGSPVWSADGKWVIFESARLGVRNLFRRAFPPGTTEQLTTTAFDDFDPAVSR